MIKESSAALGEIQDIKQKVKGTLSQIFYSGYIFVFFITENKSFT